MVLFRDAWDEERRRRWMRPDAHLWLAVNPERFGPLDLDVFGDARMCNNCRKVLPYVGLELGNPTVTFVGPHGRYTMRDGMWISMEK